MNMNNKYNNKNNMIQISKWGFGMAPLKKPTDEKNRQSISAVLSFVDKNEINNSNNLIEQISWVKGLFNRIIRQDQWDWFTINSYFDFPKEKDVINIVSALSTLRNAIMNHNDSLGEKALQTLQMSAKTMCELESDVYDLCSLYLIIRTTPKMVTMNSKATITIYIIMVWG